MKRILVPTDFSAIADYGLQMAIQVARRTGAEIFLLNMIAPFHDSKFSAMGAGTGGGISEESRFIVELRRLNEDKLLDIAGYYYESGIRIHPAIVIDEVQEGIGRFIDKYQIGLVVMGTSGESTYTEFFTGNHTEQVMRTSHCPVLTVRRLHRDFEVKNIVLATDLAKETNQGVPSVKEFADYFDARIHLLHVVTGRTSSEKKAKEELEAFATNHAIKGTTAHVVKNTNPREAILHFAREKQADLIAVITYGRTGLSNLVFGSVSEDLVKAANVPVLTASVRGRP